MTDTQKVGNDYEEAVEAVLAAFKASKPQADGPGGLQVPPDRLRPYEVAVLALLGSIAGDLHHLRVEILR